MCKVCEMVKDNEKHVIRKKLNRQIFIILRFVDCTSKTPSCCFIKFITLLNRCLWYFLKIIWRKELLGLLVLQENNWVIRELKWESLHCDRPNIDRSLLTFLSLALLLSFLISRRRDSLPLSCNHALGALTRRSDKTSCFRHLVHFWFLLLERPLLSSIDNRPLFHIYRLSLRFAPDCPASGLKWVTLNLCQFVGFRQVKHVFTWYNNSLRDSRGM